MNHHFIAIAVSAFLGACGSGAEATSTSSSEVRSSQCFYYDHRHCIPLMNGDCVEDPFSYQLDIVLHTHTDGMCGHEHEAHSCESDDDNGSCAPVPQHKICQPTVPPPMKKGDHD